MRSAPQISQFSDASIPFDTAVSLCGPAAAVAFARVNGRNPSLQEAKALAEQVGWTAEAGMAGPQSQQALLQKMGVDADLTPSADWQRVTADVQAGKPVIVSTPRHYFTVSDFDPAKGYYVGTSGTGLKDGAEWMSAEQITSAGRGVNGALHLKNAPLERQKFLEANTQSGGDGGGPSAGPPTASPLPAPGTPGAAVSDSAQVSQADPFAGFLKGMQQLDGYSRRLAAQLPEPTLPKYQLPGVPKVEMGWGSRYRMPG